jgi:hypothetical protein
LTRRCRPGTSSATASMTPTPLSRGGTARAASSTTATPPRSRGGKASWTTFCRWAATVRAAAAAALRLRPLLLVLSLRWWEWRALTRVQFVRGRSWRVRQRALVAVACGYGNWGCLSNTRDLTYDARAIPRRAISHALSALTCESDHFNAGWKVDGTDPYIIEYLTPISAAGYTSLQQYQNWYYGHTFNYTQATNGPDTLIMSRPVDSYPVAFNISAFLRFSPPYGKWRWRTCACARSYAGAAVPWGHRQMSTLEATPALVPRMCCSLAAYACHHRCSPPRLQ